MAFIYIILAMVFMGLKADAHLQWISLRRKESYPGFWLAYVRASLFERMQVGVPIPVSGREIPISLQRRILIYSFLTAFFIILLFMTPEGKI